MKRRNKLRPATDGTKKRTHLRPRRFALGFVGSCFKKKKDNQHFELVSCVAVS